MTTTEQYTTIDHIIHSSNKSNNCVVIIYWAINTHDNMNKMFTIFTSTTTDLITTKNATTYLHTASLSTTKNSLKASTTFPIITEKSRELQNISSN